MITAAHPIHLSLNWFDRNDSSWSIWFMEQWRSMVLFSPYFFFLFRTFQPIFMEFRPEWFKNIKAYNIRLYMCNLIYILCSEMFSWKHRTNKSATTTKKESKSLWWMRWPVFVLWLIGYFNHNTKKKTRIILIDRQIEWYSVDNCCYGTLSLVSMLKKPQSASFSLVNVHTTKLSANQYGVNPCDDH